MNKERLLEIKGEIDERAANARVLTQLFDLLILDALIEESFESIEESFESIEESFESIEDEANGEPTD